MKLTEVWLEQGLIVARSQQEKGKLCIADNCPYKPGQVDPKKAEENKRANCRHFWQLYDKLAKEVEEKYHG